jgi:hypothetical protein
MGFCTAARRSPPPSPAWLVAPPITTTATSIDLRALKRDKRLRWFAFTMIIDDFHGRLACLVGAVSLG